MAKYYTSPEEFREVVDPEHTTPASSYKYDAELDTWYITGVSKTQVIESWHVGSTGSIQLDSQRTSEIQAKLKPPVPVVAPPETPTTPPTVAEATQAASAAASLTSPVAAGATKATDAAVDHITSQFTSTFISNKARRGDFAVYIAGVKAPATFVSVTNTVWQFPVAQIGLPPDPELIRFGAEDKAHVVIFYRDTFVDRKLPQYRMLFEGEICAWSYNKNGSNRGITLEAIGVMHVFTQFNFSVVYNVEELLLKKLGGGSTYDTLNRAREAVETDTNVANAIGADAGVSVFRLDQTSTFQMFQQGFSNTGDVTSPIQYIQQAIQVMAGDQQTIGESLVTGSALLDGFFKPYLGAHSMFDRVGTFGEFDGKEFTVLKTLQAASQAPTLMQMGHLIASQLKKGTMWDFFNYTFRTLFHEIHMTSTPTDTAGHYKDIVTKPQTMFTAIPRCNTIFPSMVIQYNFNEQYWVPPTRLFAAENSLFMALSQSVTTEVQRELELARAMRGAPEPFRSRAADHRNLNAASSQTAPAAPSTEITPEEAARGPHIVRTRTGYVYRAISEGSVSKEVGLPQETTPSGSFGLEYDGMQYFADYEYARQRAIARTGSVDLTFNPYISHGFPAIIFDDLRDRMHMSGYVSSVTHTLTVNDFKTTVMFNGLTPLVEGSPLDRPFLPALEGLSPDSEAANVTLGQVLGSATMGRAQFRKAREEREEFSYLLTEGSTVTKATVKTLDPGLPVLDNIYHSRDIIGTGTTTPGMTTLGDLCFRSFDFAIENYSNRPILTMTHYLAQTKGAPIYWDPLNKDNTLNAPDEFIALAVTPWTRLGSKNLAWAVRIRKISKKAKAHGVYFNEVSIKIPNLP